MICAGNDLQFQSLATTIGAPSLIEDPRFRTNSDRVTNRDDLRTELESRLRLDSCEYWSGVLGDAGVPAGPVNDVEGGFGLAASLGLDPVDEIDGVKTARSPTRPVRDPGRDPVGTTGDRPAGRRDPRLAQSTAAT